MLDETIDTERIYALWDELSDFEASRMPEARVHLLSVLMVDHLRRQNV